MKETCFLMPEVVSQSSSLLKIRFEELLKAYNKRIKNTKKALRLFYKMMVFDGEFDIALIEFLRQVIGNFINKFKESKIKQEVTLGEEIENYNKSSVNNFINDCVLKDEEDPSKIVFVVAPIVMGVDLVLLEYPKPSKDNAVFYSKKLELPEFQQPKFINHKHELKLLRSNTIFYDVLYNMEEIRSFPILLTYDEGIDAIPVNDGDLILTPICCNKGYYLPGYYRTMVNKYGSVSKTCVACKKNLDDLTYQKLKKFKKTLVSYKVIIAGGLTILAYAVSMGFAITHGLFY